MKTKYLLLFYLFLASSFIAVAQNTTQQTTNSVSVLFSFPSFFQKTNFNVNRTNGAKVEIVINQWSPFGVGYEKQNASGDIFSAGIWGMSFDLGSSTNKWLNPNEINGGQIIQSFQSNLILESKIKINKKPSSLERFIGLGIYPIIGYYADKPTVSTDYPISVFYTGADVALILATRYRFSDRFAFDVSLPVNFFRLSYNSMREENPIFTVQQQQTATISIESLKFSLRPCFGLVLSL